MEFTLVWETLSQERSDCGFLQMECNKDEALRAKEIAEKKFATKDFEGAKKFVLKAQTLYPGLEGLPQMLATFYVYICASSKTNGEADLYSILGINPSADDETVKKHYKKLALMLHPDKNKSIGAEGAFQLISEAWSVLSDKSRRALYDQKRNSVLFSQKKPPTSNQVRKATPAANGSYDFSKSTGFSGRENKNTFRADSSSASGTAEEEKPGTFWTVCHKCKMQYEYLRIVCNCHLLCQNCSHSFLALETPAPSAYGVKRNLDLKSVGNTRTSNDISGGLGDTNSAAKFRWTPCFQSGASNVVSAAQQTYENAVREFEEALAAEKQDKNTKRKYDVSQKMSGASSSNHVNFAKKRKDVEEPHGVKDLSQIEICNILVDKARKLIDKKISTHESNRMPNGQSP
ncbi:hypothetical protein V2J09_020754 [Rumex salicifolius]